MLVNLVVIFLILVFGLIYSQGDSKVANSNRNRKNYIKLISVILILQSGLRNVAVGADTFAYYLRFEDTLKTSWNEIFQNFGNYYKYGIGKDPGYPIFEKITQIIFPNYQLLLFVIAIIFFYALGRFIFYNTYKLSHAILTFVIYAVLFYSFFSITGHRQTIATAAALYSFEWLKKRKLLPFVLILLLASSIHKSVLIYLPFYFIGNFKRPKLLFVLAFLSFPILMVLRNQMIFFIQALGGYELYEIYEGAGTLTFTSMYLFICVVVLFRLKYVLKIKPETRYYCNALAIGLLFLPLTWVNPSAMRIVQYFSIFMLILLPLVVESFKQYSLKIQRATLLVAIFILVFLFINSNTQIEYHFFWQQMQLDKNYS